MIEISIGRIHHARGQYALSPRGETRYLAVSAAHITYMLRDNLMSADPNDLGFADFGNLWGVLMLVKHILILGMLAMGFWFNGILRVGPLLVSNSGAARAFGLMRLYANGMAAAGLLVLLLTAVSQAQ